LCDVLFQCLQAPLDCKLVGVQLVYRQAISAPSTDSPATLALQVVAGMARTLHMHRSAHPEIDLQAQHTTHLFSMKFRLET
jgi:hypothetical protein